MNRWELAAAGFACSASLAAVSAQGPAGDALAVQGVASLSRLCAGKPDSSGKAQQREALVSTGRFQLQFRGTGASVRIELPGRPAISLGRSERQPGKTSQQTTWRIDPIYGPLYRDAFAARADCRLLALLRGNVAEALGDYDSERRVGDELRLATDDVATVDTWTFDSENDRLRTAVLHTETPTGGTDRVELQFDDWVDYDGHGYPNTIVWRQPRLRTLTLRVDSLSTMADSVDSDNFVLAAEFERAASEFGLLVATGTATPRCALAALPSPTTREATSPAADPAMPNSLAILWHVGDVNDLPSSRARLEKWLELKGLVAVGPMHEEPWTDPQLQPDPARHLIRLSQPTRAR